MTSLRLFGAKPRIRIDRNEILISNALSGSIREELLIMNEGSGRLYGSVRSEVPWIIVLNNTLDTTFIQRIPLEIRCDKAPMNSEAWITIISTGGINRVKIILRSSPVQVSSLILDERNFQFCNCSPDEKISFHLTIRNGGKGFLSGTVTSLSEWIEIPCKGIWTRDIQKIPINVDVRLSPMVRHPIGRMLVRTNGGEETVEVSIHRSLQKGPSVILDPPTLRINWRVKGVIEENINIRNTGTGILRGTIPSKYKWISIFPSIFSVETTLKCTVRVDTRILPPSAPASVTLDVITNAGRYTLDIEIIRARTPEPPVSGIRVSVRRSGKYRPRSRITVMDENHIPLILISSGKSGGEGEIWYVEGDDTVCVKLFHPHRISSDLEEKLKFMQLNPFLTPPDTDLCWPKGRVSDQGMDGRFLGYIMKRLDTESYKPAHLWYDSGDMDELFGFKATSRLASLVNSIHKSGHCIGDLRENNLFVSRTGEVCLIDTDSFQISSSDSSRIWFCKVGTGEYLPPEILDGSFNLQEINRLYADRFALAVLIFKFLMKGVHPYQAKGSLIDDAPSTTDKILRGYFAFEGKTIGLTPPGYAPSYERLPPDIRALFHESFVRGHGNPKARPDAGRWMTVLGGGQIKNNGKIKKPPVNIVAKGLEDSFNDRGLYYDKEGICVTLLTVAVKIHYGKIWDIDRKNFQLLIPSDNLNLTDLYNDAPVFLPPSVLYPVSMVKRGDKRHEASGFIIPLLDTTRYVHWHIASDPQSRRKRWGETFTFRHRMAACLNFISSLLSVLRSGFIPYSLSSRSVFVGPDSSVRIIAIPGGIYGEYKDRELLENTRILFTQMLMDGYHPDKIFSKSHNKKTDHSPSPEIIPFPLNYFLSGISDLTYSSIDEVLTGLYKRTEWALYSLKQCKNDSNHWYTIMPGWCPWCTPYGLFNKLLMTRKVIPLTFVNSFLLLSEPDDGHMCPTHEKSKIIILSGFVVSPVIYLSGSLNPL